MSKLIKLPSIERLKTLLIPKYETGQLYCSKTGQKRGTLTKRGYVQISIDGVAYRAHRIIWKMWSGDDPEYIDHINRNRSDNRIKNLRNVSYVENYHNLTPKKKQINAPTGVIFFKGKWRAEICVNRQIHRLGTFETIGEAAAARLAAEQQHSFHPNHGRAL